MQFSRYKCTRTTFNPSCHSTPLRFVSVTGIRPIKIETTFCLHASMTQNPFSIFARLIAFVQMEMERFELLTPCLQGRCSPN